MRILLTSILLATLLGGCSDGEGPSLEPDADSVQGDADSGTAVDARDDAPEPDADSAEGDAEAAEIEDAGAGAAENADRGIAADADTEV